MTHHPPQVRAFLHHSSGRYSVEAYIIATCIAARVAEWLRASSYLPSTIELERLVAKRGAFHIARVAAFLWRKTDSWQGEKIDLVRDMTTLETYAASLSSIFPEAFSLLLAVIQSDVSHTADVDRALKSAGLDKDIDKILHTAYAT